jgi:hypothetical protein
MTPEQKIMLEKFGVYPTISGEGSKSSRGGWNASGELGMVAALLKNLKLNAAVRGYGYETPDSGFEIFPHDYKLGVDWEPNERSVLSLEAKRIPSQNESRIGARLKYKF